MLSVYYIDATDGNDSWTGSAGTYTSGTTGPWKTLDKVNSASLSAGDSVLFQRGEIWRGQLQAQSGSAAGDITYGAYGSSSDAKPQILGSVELNSTSDWNDLGDNIWSTDVGTVTTDGSELLANPSFDTDTSYWSLSVSGDGNASGSRDTSVYDSSPAGYSITCIDSGTGRYDIRLFSTNNMSITEGEYYLLNFRAKCTTAFDWANRIELLQVVSPFPIVGDYAVEAYSITTSWQTYNVLFQAKATTGIARFSFPLGDAIPNGSTFSLDTMSFKHCELSSEVLGKEIGNTIYDGASCGVAEWSLDGVDAQGDFYYDTSDWTVKVYSTSNPASYYSDIELAQTRDCVNYNGGSYITFEDLDLRYSSSSGTDGVGVDHLTIRGLDVSFMGGGVLGFWNNGTPKRFGNGIDFYGDASYILVEDCKIWEIYDAALSNQCSLAAVEHDIVYRNNVIWNSEYSYEYFVSGEEGTVYDIYFENNTCLYAGYGWGNAQRHDPVGWSLKLRSLADTDDFYIRNNIIYEATGALVGLWGWTDLEELTMDNNLLYSSDNNYASWNWANYTSFVSYQTVSGKEANSINKSPEFVNPVDSDHYDFRLQAGSPAINAGVDTSISYDYRGVSRPQYNEYDIGAYEFYDYVPNAEGLVAHWELDETSGTVASDSYGSNDCVINGATVNQTGQVNTAYEFDGTNDYLAVPLMNYDELTISAWFYRDIKDGGSDTIFTGLRWSTTALAEGYGLHLDANSDEIDFLVATTTSDGTKTRGTCSYDLGDSVGQWYYVTGTYDSSTGTQTLYINGEVVDTFAHTAGNTIVPMTYYSNAKIGYSHLDAYYFDGRIDDFKIFNRPLTAGEVAHEYQYGSIVARWALDEKQGTTAYDLTSYGNTGTSYGATVNQTGQIGAAYEFDGTDDYVSVPLINYDELSISAWFYRDVKDEGSDTIFTGCRWGVTSVAEGYGLHLDANSDEIDFLVATKTAGDVRTKGECSYNLGDSVGRWYYVAGTYDSSTGTQTLYVDGVAVDTFAHTAGNTVVPMTYRPDMRIGDSRIDAYYFDGRIDDLRIYKRPLTVEEVDRDFQNGAMVAYWKMDELATGSVIDSCGTNNGVNYGAAVNQTGQVGTAYEFDGTDDYIAVSPMNYDEITISAWFYRDVKDAGSDTILTGLRWSTTANAEGYGLHLDANSDEIDFLVATKTSGGTKTRGTCSYDLGDSVGSWFYVVGTYDMDTGVQTLYIDGSTVDTFSHTAGNTIVPMTYYSDMKIGISRLDGYYFDGRIDDLRIYSKPLTADEVEQNYYWGGTFAMTYEFYGDANFDGIVNDVDATILATNWQRHSGVTWSQGDFNRDGRVDDLDATLLAANWTRTLPPATSSSATTAPKVSYDLDKSGKVDLGDLSFFATVYREKPGISTENPYAYAADFDSSGTVDLGDLALFAANYQQSQSNDLLAQPAEASQSKSAAPETAFNMAAVPAIMPGDANRDGRVDEHDASMVARNWKTKKHVTWADGDFNGDDIINDLDAAIVAQHWMMTNDDLEDNAHDEVFATFGVAESALLLP